MDKSILHGIYPIFIEEIDKQDSVFSTTQQFVDELISYIDEHPVSRFIAEFDHYSHTRGLSCGEINDDILDARNVVFCFGTKLTTAEILAVRPRSIGVVETRDKFILSFMEAPSPPANKAMKEWLNLLSKRSDLDYEKKRLAQ